MKRLSLFLALAAVATLRADDAPAPAPSQPLPPPGQLDEATVAHQGYPAYRYESLWTKSPFSVETPEDNTTESAEYSLVGVAEIDGVSYVNLVEKDNQNHFLISSDKTINGLIVTSVTHRNGEIYATINRNGEVLTLKLESAAGTVAGGNAPPGGANGLPPGIMPPNIPMPMSNTMPSTRPLIRIHRPVVRLPQQQGFQPQPPPPVILGQ